MPTKSLRRQALPRARSDLKRQAGVAFSRGRRLTTSRQREVRRGKLGWNERPPRPLGTIAGTKTSGTGD
jgi:hypothetical protein